MDLFTLLKQEIQKRPGPFIAFGVVSGVSNAYLTVIINAASETVANDKLNWKYFMLYVLCLGIFFISKRYMLYRSSEIVEAVVNRIRYRLADKVRFTELATLEKYSSSMIYTRLTQEAGVISTVSTTIISGAQGVLMIFFTLFYLATLSVWSFTIVVISLALSVIYFMAYSETHRAMLKEVSRKETMFFEKIGHILQGFNEINVNRRKNEDVFNAYIQVNNAVRDSRVKTSKYFNITLVFTEMFFYLLLGAILFALPMVHAEQSVVIIKVITALLFIIAPLESVIYSIPGFANANSSARNIMELEAQLEEDLERLRGLQTDKYSPAAYHALPFENQLDIKELVYQYSDKNSYETGFQVGPIDLTVRKGELIFITGGNGSGKSTFLKLLTGLYKPSSGQVKIDGGDGRKGSVVNMRNYQQYQNLFSIVFSDYHLFDKIYGLEREIDPAEVETLMKFMELPEGKTGYKNGAFTNINLSSGQKKRLALVSAILEDKPIYIFDEVAADLDPEFRDKFYFEILRDLKSRNKTILVVSHDQQYWQVPDRLIDFKDGMMRELSKKEVNSLVSIALKKS